MRKITLVILSLLSCFITVAKTHKQKKKKQAANELVSVEMFRTGCFGHCPTYTVVINKNGTATYDAIRFNTDSGVFQKNIGTKKATAILNEVNTYRVDTCQDEYRYIPDMPNINFTFTYTNKTKKINNARSGPQFLQALAREIDEAGLKKDDAGWKKLSGSPAK